MSSLDELTKIHEEAVAEQSRRRAVWALYFAIPGLICGVLLNFGRFTWELGIPLMSANALELYFELFYIGQMLGLGLGFIGLGAAFRHKLSQITGWVYILLLIDVYLFGMTSGPPLSVFAGLLAIILQLVTLIMLASIAEPRWVVIAAAVCTLCRVAAIVFSERYLYTGPGLILADLSLGALVILGVREFRRLESPRESTPVTKKEVVAEGTDDPVAASLDRTVASASLEMYNAGLEVKVDVTTRRGAKKKLLLKKPADDPAVPYEPAAAPVILAALLRAAHPDEL